MLGWRHANVIKNQILFEDTCSRVSFSEGSPCKGFLLHLLLIPNFSSCTPSCVTCLHFVLGMCHIHAKIKMGTEDFGVDRSLRTPKVSNIKKYIIELHPPPKIIVFTQSAIYMPPFITGDDESWVACCFWNFLISTQVPQ